MNYVIVCMHLRLCVHVHAHVYFLYTCRYVYIYMCANVYMCASVTRTHVYICVRRREMGVYSQYFIIDHTMGSYIVYICAPMCMCVHVYASISIYIHAFTYAYVRTCNKYIHA